MTQNKMNQEQFETFLARALKRRANAPQADQAAVERVLARLSGPLPRQQAALWRLPAVLLDWQFAPAWPRMAALAGCAALGFAIGIAGLDRSNDRPDSPFTFVDRTDFASIIFEPEPLTGARP